MRLGSDLPGAKVALDSFPKTPVRDQLQHEYSLALDQRDYEDRMKRVREAANKAQPGSANGIELNGQLIRALATSEQGAMAFLNMPCHERQYKVPNAIFTLMLRRTQGLSLLTLDTSKSLMCAKCSAIGRPVLLSPNHLETCHKETTSRHNAVRDIFFSMFRGLGLTARLEPHTPVDGNRWDLAVNNMAHDGIKRYYDFTIVVPFKAAFSRKHNPFPESSLEPLHDDAIKEKLTRYNEDLCKLRAFPLTSFTAMPFSSFGGMSDPVIRVLDVVQSQAKKFRSPNSTWATDSTYTAYFAAACSFAINAYTCYSISHTISEAISLQNKLVGAHASACAAPLPQPASIPAFATPRATRPLSRRAASHAPSLGPFQEHTEDTRITSTFSA